MRLDHLIVAVADLEQAMADYRSLGFTVFFGGQHAGGVTHNALICLADASYIELIAPVDPATQPQDSPYLGPGQGFAGFALLAEELDGVVVRLKNAKVDFVGPTAGGRARTDGVQLQWQSLFLDGSISPFVITDVTARDLRVPDDPETIEHANGAVGIAALEVVTPNLMQTRAQYDTLFGRPSHVAQASLEYAMADIRLTLRPAALDSMPSAPLPVRCTLWCTPPAPGAESSVVELDPQSTHGAAFIWQIRRD